jgi:hypothetical protein
MFRDSLPTRRFVDAQVRDGHLTPGYDIPKQEITETISICSGDQDLAFGGVLFECPRGKGSERAAVPPPEGFYCIQQLGNLSDAGDFHNGIFH